MIKFLILSITIIVSVVISSAFGLGSPKRSFPRISTLRLIANPEKYQEKEIQISGWLSIATDGHIYRFFLFATHEGFEYDDRTQVIELEMKSLEKILPNDRAIWRLLDREYILVQGRFSIAKTENEMEEEELLLKDIDFLNQVKPGPPILSEIK